jgi:hypothetical protein
MEVGRHHAINQIERLNLKSLRSPVKKEITREVTMSLNGLKTLCDVIAATHVFDRIFVGQFQSQSDVASNSQRIDIFLITPCHDPVISRQSPRNYLE